MSYDFPASPVENQEFTPAGGATYVFHAPRWQVKTVPAGTPLWVQMTQAAYDALPVKDPDILYVVIG